MDNPYEPPASLEDADADPTPRFAIWNLARLKQNLAERRVPEHHGFIYLLLNGFLILLSGTSFLYSDAPDAWDHVDSGLYLVTFLLGTLYLYARNGGREGQDFLLRFFALTWVFGLRFVVLLILPVSLIVIPGLYFLQDWLLLPEEFPLEDILSLVLGILLEIVYYWRLGHHLRDVSERAASD